MIETDKNKVKEKALEREREKQKEKRNKVFSLGSVEQVLSNKHRRAVPQARTTNLTDSWELSLTASFMLHDMRNATQLTEKLPAPLRVWEGEGLAKAHTYTRMHLCTWGCFSLHPCTVATKLQTQKYPLSHTTRQKERHAISLHRWAEEGNTPVLQLLSGRKRGVVGWGGWMYAVCRLNLFHMMGLGLFLSTALLSSKESGSVTTWLPKRHCGERVRGRNGVREGVKGKRKAERERGEREGRGRGRCSTHDEV